MPDLETEVKTIQLLRETVEAMVARHEQLFKMQEEVLSLSRQSILDMKTAISQAVLELQATREQHETAIEALRRALSDLDGNVDDLAKVTQALLQVQRQLNPSNQPAQTK